MSNFPSAVPLRYPIGRTVKSPSRVVEFLDGSEQRWQSGPVLNALSLSFTNIPKAEVDDVQDWFLSVKGAFDSSWSITVGPDTFANMALEHDELAVTESDIERYSLTLNMRQTAPSGSWPSVSSTFPGLGGGKLTQRPWSGKDQFLTTRNDLDGGARFAWYERGTPRRAWELQYPMIGLTQLADLMNHFVQMGGRWGAWSLDDPDSGTTYANSRYDTDEFKAQYVNAGHCSVTLPIVSILA